VDNRTAKFQNFFIPYSLRKSSTPGMSQFAVMSTVMLVWKPEMRRKNTRFSRHIPARAQAQSLRNYQQSPRRLSIIRSHTAPRESSQVQTRAADKSFCAFQQKNHCYKQILAQAAH